MSGTDILSRIQILLDANTANFEQKLNEAKDTSVSTFDKIKSSAKVMGVAVASGSVAAVGALIAMADAQAQQAQQIEIAAYKAQASTTEFQKNSIAARQVGIETEQLGDIYKDFNEKVGEMITAGSGGMVDWMEQVAVKTEGGADGAMRLAKEMATLSGPAAMGVYVAKMEEANLSLDQQNFLMESMASESQMLLPLYRDNAEQVRLWGDAAERTGMILDEQGIQKAAEFRAQSELLKMQLEGAKTQLVQAVIPAFVDIADAFNTGDKEARAMADGGEVLANILRGVAAIAMGLYTTVNLVANSMAGVAASATSAMNVVDQAAQAKSAKWYDKLPGVKLFKASVMVTADFKTPDGIIADMKDQNARIAEEGAAMIGKVFDNATSEAAAKMADIYGKSNDAQAKATQGTKDWIDKQNESAGAASKESRAQAEVNRKLLEQENLRKRALEQASRLIYEYGDELLRIEEDLKSDLAEIHQAALKIEAKDRYSALAKAQAESRKQLFVAELENELYEHRKTEEEKLADELRINKLRLDAQRGLNKNELELRKKALEDKYRLELSQIEEEKRARVNSASAAWGGTYSDMTGQGEDHALSQQRFSRTDQSQELFDAQMALADTAEEREAIWEAHHNRMQFIEQEYFRSRANMQLQWGMSYVQGAAGVMAQVFGENSKAYQAMFAVQKAMAIAQVMMNAPATFSAVMASASMIPLVGPFIAPGLAAGAVALQMAQAAAIGSVSFQPVGMAHDGIDRVPEEGSWWLDKGERVLKEQTSSKLDSTLDEIRRTNREPAYDMPMMQPEVNNIYALDGKSVERVLRKHSRHVAGSMKGYARNFGR